MQIGLETFGLVIITEMPCEVDTMLKIFKRVGGYKKTHYGDTFHVISKNDPNNLAYTSTAIGLHGDQPYYDYSPCVQLLHCIKQYQFSGGENEFSDAFMTAKVIREEHPEEWKILTQVPINFLDIGVGAEEGTGHFHKMTAKPTLELDYKGELIRVNYHNFGRDSVLQVTSNEDARAVYAALKLFDRIMYEDRHIVHYKLKEGECVVFDNQRVLHGRTSFTVLEGYGPLIMTNVQPYHGSMCSVSVT